VRITYFAVGFQLSAVMNQQTGLQATVLVIFSFLNRFPSSKVENLKEEKYIEKI